MAPLEETCTKSLKELTDMFFSYEKAAETKIKSEDPSVANSLNRLTETLKRKLTKDLDSIDLNERGGRLRNNARSTVECMPKNFSAEREGGGSCIIQTVVDVEE